LQQSTGARTCVLTVGHQGASTKNGLASTYLAASEAAVCVDASIRTTLLKRALSKGVIDQDVRPPAPAGRTEHPDLPAQIGPCQFGRFGGWVTVRCPREFAPLMRMAGGMWDPGARQWCIVPRRIGPVLQEVLRTTRSAAPEGADHDWRHRRCPNTRRTGVSAIDGLEG